MGGSVNARERVDLRVAVTACAMVLGSKVGDTFKGLKKIMSAHMYNVVVVVWPGCGCVTE